MREGDPTPSSSPCLPDGTGLCLAAAALLFWISWALMPGVGVTDAAQILALVGAHRGAVLWSAALQLLSAALYVPALLGIGAAAAPARVAIRWGAGILLLGAMGSAADAVFHVLAYAMTEPGVDPAPLIPVMRFMQGPALLMIAPLILAFFVGSLWLSVALARAGVIERWHPWLYALAPAVVGIGAALARRGAIAPRLVGLSLLAVFAAAQVHAGLRLQARGGCLRATDAAPDRRRLRAALRADIQALCAWGLDCRRVDRSPVRRR